MTGVAVEPIVDAQRKADLLRELAQKEGLSRSHIDVAFITRTPMRVASCIT